MEGKDILKILKALGDDTRLQIFEMLRDGPLCACKILENLNITQPTLSHHMKILCNCKLVIARKEWKWMHYEIDCSVLNVFLSFIGDTKYRR